MKKIKLLTPLLGVTALSSMAIPLVSCSSTSTVTLGCSELPLKRGETATLKATTTSGKTITWKSSNTAIATVKDGKVTAVAVGNATVTAEADGQKAECKVTVTDDTVIVLNHSTLALRPEGTEQLTATVSGEPVTPTWGSDKEDVATVDADGKVTAIADGVATITAKLDDYVATCEVTVTTKTIVELNHTEATIEPKGTLQLEATVTPVAEVTWASSDETIATVDENGLVTAVKDGEAIITATADGEEAKCKLTVATVVPSSTDTAYLTAINSKMVYGKPYASPHEAITALKDVGYDVINYKLSNSKLEFAFDASVKKFIIMNGDQVVGSPTGYEMENSQVVFKFTNKYNKDSKYGQYLLDEYKWDDPTERFDIIASIDVGNNKNIKYMNYAGDASNAGATKLVRTYCEYLNFAANSDNIIHMGESNNINVYGTDAEHVCNYIEVGRTAYLYAENVALNIAKINEVDKAQIDVVESKNVSKGEQYFHDECVTMYIGDAIPGAKATSSYQQVKDSTELNKAITDGVKFIRLKNDITLEVASTITVDSKSFVLDLAGNKLIDGSTITAGQPLISVTATSADSSLMFIDSYRTDGELTLNDHFVKVQGDAANTHSATLYLEGANITYNAGSGRNGAIEVGDASATSQKQQYSRVYMYGGKITALTDSVTHDIESSGIYANNNSYIQIQYGAIYSSVNCVRSNGKYDNSYIDIVDGTFKTISSELGECIYMPNGTLNITGGTYEGHTCIGIRGGNTNISGGYFHATGDNAPIDKAESASSGIGGDGSVICVELCNGSGPTVYGSNPSLTVHNATLYSEKSYIMQIFRNNSTVAVDQFFEADFFGGVYYYGTEVESPTYSGIRTADPTVAAGFSADNYRIYQQSGSWIYVPQE